MTLLSTLLSLPAVVAFDVDSTGRLLVGYDGSGVRQLYEVSHDGEWRALTDLADRVGDGQFVPGTSQVIVQHDTGGNERGQLSLLDLADPLLELKPLVHEPDYFHSMIEVRADRLLYTTNRRNGTDFDLIARDLAGGDETTLWAGGGYVMSVSPSPDGRWVAVVRAGGPANSNQLLLVGAGTTRTIEVTSYDDPTHLHAVSWRADSAGLLVASDAGRDRIAVLAYELATGELTSLLVDEQRDLAGWVCPDGEHVLVATTDDGEISLALHRLAGGALVAPLGLPAGGWAARHTAAADPLWSKDGAYALINYNSPTEPPCVIRYNRESGELFTIRAPDMPALPANLPTPESHRVKSFDGEQIPVFVYRPADGGDGSAVVLIHGGPEWMSARVWHPMTVALAGQGHTVIVPNVRGSAGYGKRWYSLDDKYLRLNSVEDLAAIHEWLPELGLDPQRAALYGGSYGGYMVLAGLAFQPERWAAGVDVVGMASLVTFLENTSNYRRVAREREYGSLAEDREFLELASPLNRVDQIRAPLLVIHGANDPRVPLSEAEQIAAALTARDVPCELLVYRDEGHGLHKRVNQLDAYPKALAFLAKTLK